MIHIDGTLISEDLFTADFCCDLDKCLGNCCNSEGESGAPLEEEELQAMLDLLPIVWDDLTPQARETIRQDGAFFKDKAGDWVTQVVNDRDCVYCTYDQGGKCLCAIEKAYREGKFKTLPGYRDNREPFMKPISCHLYPVRIKKIGEYISINYDRQEKMCRCARILGKKQNMKVYQCLKEALIRRFGESWYRQLELCRTEMEKAGLI